MTTHLDLGKMVGPLPMGAWVGVVGGGLAFMAYQRKQSNVVPSDAVGTATAPSDPTSGDYGTVGDGSVGGWVDSTPAAGAVTAPVITNNDDWGRAAVNWLIAQGYNPAVADSAIRKYLDQEAGYSSQEYALVTLALGHLGATPVMLPAPVFGKPPVPVGAAGGGGSKPTPKPVTKPRGGSTKPRVRHYTVKRGDTLSSIGAKFHVPWQHIYNANRGKIGSNPNIIHAGIVLTIPAS